MSTISYRYTCVVEPATYVVETRLASASPPSTCSVHSGQALTAGTLSIIRSNFLAAEPTIVKTLALADTTGDYLYTVGKSTLSADRTITLPVATGDDTFVLADTAATLTGKTITSGTNTVRANQLATAGSDVVVSAAAAPSAGQVLTASSSTAAAWSPATITVKDEGSNVSNTPHSALNFTGTGVSVSDEGSGVAAVDITPITAGSQVATGTNSITTTSTTYTDLSTAISITMNTGSMVFIDFSMLVSNSSIVLGQTTSARVTNSGASVTYAESCATIGTLLDAMTIGCGRLVTGLTPGSNTFKVQWKTTAGTATSNGTLAPRVLTVVPLN